MRWRVSCFVLSSPVPSYLLLTPTIYRTSLH